MARITERQLINGSHLGTIWDTRNIGASDKTPASVITVVTPSVDVSQATIGQAYTGKLSVITQAPDDGSYTYSWRFDNGTGSESGITMNDQTIASPTITGVPDSIPGPGFMYAWCYVTDSFSNVIHAGVKIYIQQAG